MDTVLVQARDHIQSLWPVIKELHPEYDTPGTPALMNNGTRICFSLRLCSGSRKSTQYARLLLECKLGRVLSRNETVDHIDGDCMNNAATNLQLLSRSDNARKGPSPSVKQLMLDRISATLKGKPRYDLRGHSNGNIKLTDEQVSAIRQKLTPYTRGLDSKVAKEYGVSRELISQIRRNKLRT